MEGDSSTASAGEIAAAVVHGEITACAVTEATFTRIERLNPILNAFTDVTAKRARRRAQALDEARAAGAPMGPLAGVPFAVKNLFHVEGLPTRTAPLVGQKTFMLEGVEFPVRPNLGIYTQPISFIGLPVVAAPVPLSPLPIGVQIIAPPWREGIALRIGHALEQAGVAVAPKPAIEEAV
jgi:Asp-tRNA(Asn)/Glu-tRNA(Gln) amidotransferase A subunit family amidase